MLASESPKKKRRVVGCDHYPIFELDHTIESQEIFPGRVGFTFFDKNKWSCARCGRKIIAVWRTPRQPLSKKLYVKRTPRYKTVGN